METREVKHALQATQQTGSRKSGWGTEMKNNVADVKQRRIKDCNKKD